MEINYQIINNKLQKIINKKLKENFIYHLLLFPNSLIIIQLKTKTQKSKNKDKDRNII